MVQDPVSVTICPTSGGPNTGSDTTGTTSAVIYMNPTRPNGIPKRCDIPSKERPPNNLKGCAATLAHELGHAVFHEPDEDEDGSNVQDNENPVRLDLGLKCRCTYHGYPVSVQPK
jgi:hypothetical protein